MRVSSYRKGRLPRGRAGMTLVEVLVALSVLLVGIWGVAKGFPALLRTVRDEAARTEMSRLAQSLTDNKAAEPSGLPALIYGNGNISPLSVPGDPDSYSTTDNPPNARDDLVHVTGERAVIPAVGFGNTEAVYAFKLGRANALEAVATAPAVPVTPQVAETFTLTPLSGTQNYTGPTGTDLPYGSFSITDAGAVTASSFVDQAHETAGLRTSGLELSYAWRDTDGKIHYVQRERIAITTPLVSPAVATVAAAALTSGTPKFESVVQGSVWGNALIGFTFAGVGSTATVSPGAVALDASGGLLRFSPADSGKTIVMDYDRDTEDATYHRVAREVWEDQLLSATNQVADTADPTQVYETVQLTCSGLEDQTPLHLPLLPNAATPVPTHILALDLTAGGAAYYEAATAGIFATTQIPAPIDYKHGRVTLHLPSALLGHTFRFFYRTVNQAMLTVLKPAERFLPADTFATSPPSPTYATDVIGSAGNPQFTVLNFLSGKDPANNPVSTAAGMMVSVDYTYLVAGNPTPIQVAGEVHALPLTSSTVNNNVGFYLTLNHPGVASVVAVRAASLRVRAWWRSESGRLQMTDIDTIIPPTPAPS